MNPSFTDQGRRRRAKVLRFIYEYMDEHVWAPSIRDISQHVGAVTSIVHFHLRALEQEGLIVRGENYGSRQLYLTDAGKAAAQRHV